MSPSTQRRGPIQGTPDPGPGSMAAARWNTEHGTRNTEHCGTRPLFIAQRPIRGPAMPIDPARLPAPCLRRPCRLESPLEAPSPDHRRGLQGDPGLTEFRVRHGACHQFVQCGVDVVWLVVLHGGHLPRFHNRTKQLGICHVARRIASAFALVPNNSANSPDLV